MSKVYHICLPGDEGEESDGMNFLFINPTKEYTDEEFIQLVREIAERSSMQIFDTLEQLEEKGFVQAEGVSVSWYDIFK